MHASGLSEDALVDGLKRGQVYVRTAGVEGLSIEFFATGAFQTVDMGSIVRAGRLRLTAVVRRASGEECRWIRRGRMIAVTPITSDSATLDLDVDAAAGDWFSVILAKERASHGSLERHLRRLLTCESLADIRQRPNPSVSPRVMDSQHRGATVVDV